MSITREQAKESVGIGWAKLIDRFYDFAPEYTEVTDVKEKFSGLRIYAFTDEASFDLIEELEKDSMHTCEFCGEVGSSVNLRGWYKTLCPKCEGEIKSKWHIA
jgi:hypothetical protein